MPPWAEADVFGLDGVLGVEGFDGVVGLEGFDGVLGVAGFGGIGRREGRARIGRCRRFRLVVAAVAVLAVLVAVGVRRGVYIGPVVPPPPLLHAARPRTEARAVSFNFFIMQFP